MDFKTSDLAVSRTVLVATLLRSCFCIYLAVSIPLRLAFVPEYGIEFQTHGTFLVLDFASSLFFLLEIVYEGRYGPQRVAPLVEDVGDESYEDVTGSFYDTPQIRIARPRCLPISAVASVPLEYLTLIPTMDGKISANQLLLNRCIRIFFLPIYIDDISKCMELRGILKNIGLHRTWKLFFAMALAGHWCCCGFFYVAKRQALNYGTITWPEDIGIYRTNLSAVESLSALQLEMLTSVPEAYVKSLYWAYITMITTGFGDIVPLSIPETIWCIFSMLVGVIITTCAIANLQLVVTNVDAAFTNFQRKTETVRKYMRYRLLPAHLQSRIISFYHYQWDLLKGADEEKFLSELPRSLQQQVANFMCRDLIASLPVLRKANTALLNALADCVEISIYSPNDDILKPGEPLRGAILISRGDVELIAGKHVQQKMKRFDSYAEESLFIKKNCEHTIRAKTFSEIFLIPFFDFQQIVQAQCDESHVSQMKEAALLRTKNSVKANKLFGSAEEVIKMTGFKRHCHPKSRFRRIWDFLILIGYLYYIFSLPLNTMRVFQDLSLMDDLPYFLIASLADLVFIIDLIFHLQCFMYYEEGLVVFDKERIRRKFVQEHSIIREAIATIPCDFLALIHGRRGFYLFRCFKVFRLSGVTKHIHTLERALAQLKGGGDHIFFRVVKLNFILIIVCHWVGCLWHACADISEELGFSDTWIRTDEEETSLSIDHSDFGGFGAYLRSTYWAIVGMSTVGYGDIVPTNVLETTFATVIILFGGLILPAVVGGLAAYLGNLNLAKRVYRQKVTLAKSYLNQCSLDQTIVDKVINYYDYLWSRQGEVDEESILNELPGPLRLRIAMFVNEGHINASFLSACEVSTQELIVSILKPRVFMPMDIMAEEGEIGTEMLFIERGEAAILSTDAEVILTVLRKGDYFGESVLLAAKVRVGSVRALTYCDTFVLNKDDFQEIMEHLPSERRKICAIVEKTMQRKSVLYTKFFQNIHQHPKCKARLSLTKFKDEKIFFKEAMERTLHRRASFRPDSKFRCFWNVIMMINCVYYAWAIPFRLAFPTPFHYYYVDWALDCFLLIDMLLHYCQFSFLHEGELITDANTIKEKYLRGAFRSDALSSFPYEVFLLFIDKSNRNLIALPIARIPKLLRLGGLPKLLSEIFRLLEDSNIQLAPLRLIEFLSGVILIAHWAACGFYSFARLKNNGNCAELENSDLLHEWATKYTECRFANTWIQRQVIDGKLPSDGGQVWQRYLRSFNWALPTLVVVVIGDVVPITSAETMYALIWMVVGVTINAAIIGNVANIVANIESRSSDFVKKADDIKKYMYEHHVSQGLQDKVNQFLVFLWKHGGVENEDYFVNELPYTLQLQVTEHTRQRHISSCPFFDFCSSDIIKALSLRLKFMLFSKGDILVHYGDMGQEMFFLERGSVEVVSEGESTILATLTAGVDNSDHCNHGTSAFFGETSLFFKKKRTNSVRAISFCEVYQLSKIDLDNELRQRDFDLTRMLSVFSAIADSNERRNKSLVANLKISQEDATKLSKLIQPDIGFALSRKKVKKMFLPNSSFRVIWDLGCFCLAIYSAIAIPYRAAYFELKNGIPPWLIFDLSVDVFFWVDFYLQCFMFTFMKNGVLMTDAENITERYRQNGMIKDLITCLPVELLLFTRGGERYILQARIIHMARIFRLPHYFGTASGYLNLLNVRLDAATELVLKMFFYYILVIHWCGCVWFAIHRFIEYDRKLTWATTDCPGGEMYAENSCLAVWNEDLHSHNICNNNDIRRCYIRSIYFVLTTLSTVGYGDIAPITDIETIFQNVVVLTGACFFAGIIGAFAAYLYHNDESGASAFKIKLQKLEEYMNYRNISPDLQNEILFYHTQKWKHSHLLDERAVIDMLPMPLQLELSYEVLGSTIRQFPVIHECTEIVRKRICHALVRQVCSPKAIIYQVGDIGWDIYFIASGLIKITLPTDLSVMDEEGRGNIKRIREKAASVGLLYRAGNHFGEWSLKSRSGVRQETVTAKTKAELYIISKEKLQDIFGYMSREAKLKLKNNLLCRNGNTWHSFDDDDEDASDTKSTKDIIDKKLARSSIKLSALKRMSLAKQKSFTMASSPDRKKFRNKNIRLRSFSAQASKEAIRHKLFQTGLPTGAATNQENNTNEGNNSALTAALNVQKLVENRQIIMETGEEEYETEDESE